MDTFGPDFKHVCINTLRYADDTTLMADSEEKLKRLLMKVKEVSEKAGLKRDIKKKKNFPRIRVFSNELALHEDMEKVLKLKVDLIASSVVSGVPKKVPLLFGREK